MGLSENRETQNFDGWSSFFPWKYIWNCYFRVHSMPFLDKPTSTKSAELQRAFRYTTPRVARIKSPEASSSPWHGAATSRAIEPMFGPVPNSLLLDPLDLEICNLKTRGHWPCPQSRSVLPSLFHQYLQCTAVCDIYFVTANRSQSNKVWTNSGQSPTFNLNDRKEQLKCAHIMPNIHR